MKEANNDNNLIMSRYPSGVTIRPRRRRYGALNFNDRSPEYRAMMAQLRSARYGSHRESTARSVDRVEGRDNGVSRIQPFLKLRRSYDAQARNNFVRDVLLFAVIVTISAWAVLHVVHALAGP